MRKDSQSVLTEPEEEGRSIELRANLLKPGAGAPQISHSNTVVTSSRLSPARDRVLLLRSPARAKEPLAGFGI